MKRHLLLFILLLTLGVGWSKAQNTNVGSGPYEFVLGTGTGTVNYLPLRNSVQYTLSQQLYLASEIVEAGMTNKPVGSISFYSVGNVGCNLKGTKIWMANVSGSAVSATSPLASGMTLVYDGEQTQVDGWNEFQLNGDFAWDGTSNILVLFQSNRGSTGSDIYWQYTTDLGFNASAFATGFYNPFNPEGATYDMGTTYNYRVNTKFKSFVGIPCPKGLKVSDVTTNSANLSWTARGNETGWNVRYRVSGDENAWTEVTGLNANATIYSITSLQENTTYEVQLSSTLGEEVSNWTASLTFHTYSGVTISDLETFVTFRNGINSGTSFTLSDMTIPAGGETVMFILGDNLDLSSVCGPDVNGGTSWTPIGNASSIPFKGAFDGNGKTISGLYINNISEDNRGLFGFVTNGFVRNLTLEGSIDANYYTGSVCARLTNGTISGCCNKVQIITTGSNTYIGGICSWAENSTITNCVNEGALDGWYVGGICYYNNGTISNCCNKADISTKYRGAGICDQNYTGSEISYCYNTGNISSSATGSVILDGIVYKNDGAVSQCFNLGNLSATQSNSSNSALCGLSDVNYGSITNCYNMGSIAGYVVYGGVRNIGSSSITANCYSAGALLGRTNVGFSNSSHGTRTNCYFDNQMGVAGSNEVGQGLTTSDMVSNSLFNDATNWVESESLYPYLAGFGSDDLVLVKAMPIYLAEGDSPNHVTQDFTLGQYEGVIWTVEPASRATLNGNAVTLNNKNGELTLTASKNGVSKSVTLFVTGFDNWLGSGTSSSPYEIYTAEDLELLSMLVKMGSPFQGVYFKLMNDINLNGSESNQWTPIGNNTTSFQGYFDGNNHSIRGLYIDKEEVNYQGLFGFVYGNSSTYTIKNLSVYGYVNGKDNVGGICGCEACNYGIVNCHNYVEVHGQNKVGGIVGYINASSNYLTYVDNCINHGAVYGDCMTGGIAGDNGDDSYYSLGGKISDCRNDGEIHGNVSTGGIAGVNYASSPNDYEYIKSCVNTGAVFGNGYTGGICGVNYGYVLQCINNGDVVGTNYVGGICGDNTRHINFYCHINECINNGSVTGTCLDSESGNYIGGIAGRNVYYINYNINTGIVSGRDYVGGLVGQNTESVQYNYSIGYVSAAEGSQNVGACVGACVDNGSIFNGYYDNQLCPIGDSHSGATGLTTSQMTSGSSSGFNLTTGNSGFSYAADRYPVQTCMKPNGVMNEWATIATAPVNLEEGTTADFVMGEFTLPSTGVWTVEGPATISNGACATTGSGVVTLIGTYGDASKKIRLNAAALPFNTQGTEEDPYLITCKSDMEALSDFVTRGISCQGKYFTVTDDIDLGEDSWTPIGIYDGEEEIYLPFSGHFDGGNHTITMNINAEDVTMNQGLFGLVVGGSISNLNVEGSVSCEGIQNNIYIGGICGILSEAELDNCSSSVTIVANRDENQYPDIYIGGLVGGNSGVISNSHYSGVMNYNEDEYWYFYVGGICGQNYGTIQGCYNTADIEGYYAGGICAENYSNVLKCYNAGVVAGLENAGGICASNTYVYEDDIYGAITDCYNTGAVTADSKAGGICGDADTSCDWEEDRYYCSITNCYNIGQVSGSQAGAICYTRGGGGFVDKGEDRSESSNVINCYYDKQMSLASDNNATGLLTSQMTTSNQLFGNDNANWVYENGLYPRLTGMADSDVAVVNATPIFLNGDETVASVFSDFNVSVLPEYIGWLSSNATEGLTVTIAQIATDGLKAVSFTGSGSFDLTATLGTASRTVKLRIPYVFEITSAAQLARLSYILSDDVEWNNDGYQWVDANGDLLEDGHLVPPYAFDTYFKLMNDISLAAICGEGVGNWQPIGYDGFMGYFNGNGHTISDLYIDNEESGSQALFGEVKGGSISNLTVEGSVKAVDYVAGICVALNNSGTLTNCHNAVALSAYSEYSYAGGVCVENYGTISNCSNSAHLEAFNVGGVCQENEGRIDHCYNVGTIEGSYIGGICSQNYNGATISNCYNVGTLIGNNEDSEVNGITHNSWSASITDCFNAGTLAGNRVYGIGYSRDDSYFTNCYNTGALFGDEYVAAICNSAEDGGGSGPSKGNNNVTNCFYDKQICTATDADATGLLTSEMTSGNSIFGAGNSNWIYTENFYPLLAGMDETDAAQVAAEPLFLSATDNAGSVINEFSVNGTSGITWTVTTNPSDILDVDGNTYTFTAEGEAVMTCSKGDIEKFVLLYHPEVKVITTAAQLAYLAEKVNEGDREGFYWCNAAGESLETGEKIPAGASGTFFKLQNDLTIAGENGEPTTWEPIGNVDIANEVVSSFSGYFNGNGHVITMNIEATDAAFVGLFGAVEGGTVTNLGVSGTMTAEVTSGEGCYVAPICAGAMEANISNCFSNVDVTLSVDEELEGMYAVGGICAINDESSISNSFNSGNVSGIGNEGIMAGGICAVNSSGAIFQCYNIGNVSGLQTGAVCGWYEGRDTDACFYDKQMCMSSDNYAYGLNTSDMTGTRLQSALGSGSWVYESGLYPRLKGFNSDAALVAVAPIFLDGGQMVRSVISDFTVSTENGVAWTADSDAVTISGDAVTINEAGSVILTATLNNGVEKHVAMTVKVIDFDLEGSGTESDPYQIYDREDMDMLSDAINAGVPFEGQCFKVMNDINLGGEENPWTPIGGINMMTVTMIPFSGHFDGDGNTISGLYIDDEEGMFQGLFGSLAGGTIENLTVEGEVHGGEYEIGGICGWSDYATFKNCVSNVEVTGIEDVAGICGGSGNITIENCVNNGNVNGAKFLGGIVGYAYGDNIVKNCANNAPVVAEQPEGEDSWGYEVGGICGYVEGTVSNSYNAGMVVGNYDCGPICGGIFGGTLTNCYFDTDMCSGFERYVADGVIGALSSDFASGILPYGFDNEVWYAVPGSYPRLIDNDHVMALPVMAYEEEGVVRDGEPFGGWYLVASPMVNSITPSVNNGLLNDPEVADFDFYGFNIRESGEEWCNVKDESNEIVVMNGKGYLVANGKNTVVRFTGDFHAEEEVVVSGISGWGLVGNPLGTVATVSCDYYKMNANHSELVLCEAGTTVNPGEAIFVNSSSVTFTPTNASAPVSNRRSATASRSLDTSKSILKLNFE